MAMRTLFAALALGVASLAPATAQASAPVALVEPSADLDRLAELLVPESGLAELARHAFDQGVRQGVVQDPELSAQIQRDPALRAYLAEVLQPELVKLLRRALPELRGEIRTVLAAELNAEEAKAAASFFGSPTGQKVYATALRTIGDNAGRSEADMRAAATAAVMASLAPEDFPAMLAFSASSAAGKMNAINPKVAAASRAWAERLTAKNAGRMNKLARKAAKRFAKTRRAA